MDVEMVGALLFVCFTAMIVPKYAQGGKRPPKHTCEGTRFTLDCVRGNMIEILSANYGRTDSQVCGQGKVINETKCISKTAKTIIEKRCNKRRYCTFMANSSVLGGDPCPSVLKYVDVIYKCVKDKTKASTTTRPPLYTTTKQIPTMPPTKEPTRTIPTLIMELPTVQKGRNSNTTNEEAKARRESDDDGFFRSLLVLLVLAKDKPKHSLLSVLAGVAAGTVLILITVVVCLCLEKKRKKNERTRFVDSDVEKDGKEELQELNQLDEKNERNSDSARSDDHVDSAFGDDEPRECNDYEASDDVAYLDAYLKAYNTDKSLPRPPLPTRNGGSQRMSRRAHNDGSKGRNYDYNSNSENGFTTFS